MLTFQLATNAVVSCWVSAPAKPPHCVYIYIYSGRSCSQIERSNERERVAAKFVSWQRGRGRGRGHIRGEAFIWRTIGSIPDPRSQDPRPEKRLPPAIATASVLLLRHLWGEYLRCTPGHATSVAALVFAASCKTLWTLRIFDDQFRLFAQEAQGDWRGEPIKILVIIRKIGYLKPVKNLICEIIGEYDPVIPKGSSN